MDHGVIVDFETTGVNPQEDQIIEIGVLEFALGDGASGPPIVTGMYSALQQPAQPLSTVIQQITGLNDAVLAGRAIDWSVVRAYLERAAIVIAHNASFDRAFLERQTELKGLDLHWGCSIRHIDWHAKGISSQRLVHIAAEQGFVNPFPHRALFDCATTFRVIGPHLDELVRRSYEREIMVRAVGAAFASKDKLKARGYRWNPGEHVWEKRVFESQIVDERAFLATEIYQGTSRHAEEFVS